MLKKLLITLSLCLLMAPAALAEDVAEESMTTEEAAPILCGGGCGDYWGGVYINVNTTVSAEVDTISLYASYAVDNGDSKVDTIDELNAAYKEMQSKLIKYGSVRRAGIYTYADWEYTNLYDGSISLKLTLNNNSQVEDVEDLMYRSGWDAWREMTMVSQTQAEMEAVPALKEMVQDKKEVYEEFLDSALGSISSINIYSWADTASYDVDSNTVILNVYADATYSTMQ